MESKKGKRCYIYTRVSTAIQIEGYSLDAQEKKLLEYAKLNEMTVVKKYCDEGKSGKSTSGRPEFLKMMDDRNSLSLFLQKLYQSVSYNNYHDKQLISDL